jgi:hypothetical protein
VANLPISGLTASASNAAATDVLPVVQTTGTGPVKMTVQQMAGGLLGSTTLTGATVTTSQPVLDLAQTWNASGVTFTGLKFNVASDTSASGSILLDLQVGAATKFRVDKSGNVGLYASSALRLGGSSVNWQLTLATTGIIQGSTNYYGFYDGTNLASGGSVDTRFYRDAAGVLGLRSSSTTTPAAMSFYTYGASPPAAPAASIARIYADTSGGKIRLMAVFPSGAAQQIAIEP